jgi:hypothetical protein
MRALRITHRSCVQRVESLTKHFGADILATEASMRDIYRSSADLSSVPLTRTLGRIRVAGKTDAIRLFQVFEEPRTLRSSAGSSDRATVDSVASMVERAIATRPAFNSALALLESRRVAEAHVAFVQCRSGAAVRLGVEVEVGEGGVADCDGDRVLDQFCNWTSSVGDASVLEIDNDGALMFKVK